MRGDGGAWGGHGASVCCIPLHIGYVGYAQRVHVLGQVVRHVLPRRHQQRTCMPAKKRRAQTPQRCEHRREGNARPSHFALFFRCSVSLCMHASISCFLSADLFLRSEQMVFAAKSGIHSFCVNTGINTTRSGRDDSFKRTEICSLFIRQKNSALNFSDNLTCVKASKRSLPRGMSASQVIGVIRSCNTLKFKIQENGS